MTGNKTWYLSRTVWAGMVAISLSLTNALGLATETVDQGMVTDVILQLATAVAGFVTVFGRIKATTRIS